VPAGLSDRIRVDAAASDAFAEDLAQFAAGLSEAERRILAALLDGATDPWGRALVDPPSSLKDSDLACLDQLSGTSKQDD
jgi:hypothetical protein